MPSRGNGNYLSYRHRRPVQGNRICFYCHSPVVFVNDHRDCAEKAEKEASIKAKGGRP